MNLGKLLSAGKSIFSSKNPVKYREDKRVYLPKFNGDKNPFAPSAVETPPVAAEKQSSPSPAAAPSAKTGGHSPAPAVRTTRGAGWASKFNPFRDPEPPAPSMVGAVQAELSLDAVKVIRNDLADAEIEVVPVKSQTVSAAEPPVLPPSRRPWSALGERLVNAE